MLNHRIIRWVVAFSFGTLVSSYAFLRISDPEPALQRAREEAVVLAARDILKGYVAPRRPLETVDPLATNRKVGKVYVYPSDRGWEVSGHYRRDKQDRWHPFLMSLDDNVELISLAVKDRDPRLTSLSLQDSRFSAVP